MNNSRKIGDFERMGVAVRGNQTIFTFRGEKEKACVLVLIRKEDGEVCRVEVPETYRLGALRSISIDNLKISQYRYYYEIDGKKVIDPYATALTGREVFAQEKADRDKNVYGAFAREGFDWKEDTFPRIAKHEMFLYKLHVRGFTMDSKAKNRGTFAAVAKRIPYLKRIGVTTLEFMPVYEFDELGEEERRQELPDYIRWREEETDLIQRSDKMPKREKLNYWGYTRGNYFAVKSCYGTDPTRAGEEYKKLIRSLHREQMECVMEMYFPEDVNPNLILSALRYWVSQYHVDGFHLIGAAVPIDAILSDALLSETKIFCESFAEQIVERSGHEQLYVYKDEYLYPARRMLNHQSCNMRDFLDQQRKQGRMLGFVNYIASNNGFTLADLFMYNDKHNEENGEDNRDGIAYNISNNYGVEGTTRRRYINTIRQLRWRNAILMLMLAQGVPLLWEGDEIGNSQAGNNNAYCQDNPIGWVNWKNEKTHKKELRFLEQVVAFRRKYKILTREKPYQFSDYKSTGYPDVSYHGESAWLLSPQSDRLCVGQMYAGEYSEDQEHPESIYIAYNFYATGETLALPQLKKDERWIQVIDSANQEEPFLQEPVPVRSGSIILPAESICVYVSEKAEQSTPARKRKIKKESKHDKSVGTF